MYAQAASQALPIAASVAVRGRYKPVPYPRLIVWCVVLVATDVLSLGVAKAFGSNLWLSWASRPIEVGLALWLLIPWQPNEFLRLAYSVAIAIVGVVVLALLILTDPQRTFSRWVAPFLGLLALSASLHTLVHRTVLSRTPLLRHDWFWVCLGLSLFWAGYVSVPVFADRYLGSQTDWVRWAYMTRACTDIAAFWLMAVGVLVSRRPAWMSGSS